jgi:HK97 family phage major capsid protein
MFINDINARIGELDAELEGIAALTDPTDDDVARTEQILAERDELRQKGVAAAERTQRIAEAHARAKAEGRTVSGAAPFQIMQRVDPYEADTRMMSTTEVRDAARAILDRPEARHLDADSKAKADGLIQNLDSRLARYTIATSLPAYRSAFAKYVSGKEMLLSNEERQAVQMADYESRTALALADANGGYAVPALLDPSVIYTGNGTANPMRQISRIVTGMDDTWRGVSSAGITASWDAEAAEVSDDGPTFGQPTVVAYKGQAFVPFSVEIDGDWGSLSASIGELFAEAKDSLETTAFATGSGSQPQGIITALVAGSGTVSNVAPDTDGALFAADLYDLFGALPPRYRSNASWMMSLDAQNAVRALGDDKLGNQTVDLKAGYGFQLLGRPVYEQSAFPDFTGTTGVANIMVVGDFRNYVIFDRVGSRVELIPHLFHTDTNLPRGQRGLIYWFRTGADSVNDNAFRLLRNT